jgi:hypothetical protein
VDGPPTEPTFPPPPAPDYPAGLDPTQRWVPTVPTERTSDHAALDVTEPNHEPDDGVGDSARIDVATGAMWIRDEPIERIWAHARRAALALGLATFVALTAFVADASISAAFDHRTFASSLDHFLVRYWYLLLVYTAAVVPATWLLVRHGLAVTKALLVERRYWKALAVVYVALPLAIAVVLFVAANVFVILLVLAVLIALFVILAHLGAF